MECEDDLYARTKYEIILGLLQARTGLRLLNAGCGSGELSFLLAERGHRVVGIDPASDHIDLARRRGAQRGSNAAASENCTFEVSSIEEFPEDEPFDGVIATDVIEHIEDDRAAFEKVVRLVKPGGSVIITVPAGPWLFGYHDEALGHFRRYSRGSLRTLVGDLCRIRSLRYFGFTLLPACFLYSKLLRKPYPVARTGDSSRAPAVAGVLSTLLRIDRRIPMPFGTSLIMEANRS